MVDVGRVADRGYWGEVLTTAAESAGLVGLVLDGGVRDVAALEAHRFPVFSATIALTGATKDKAGTVGSPVLVGGVSVAMGDWVVADVDGVAFVPGGSLDAVLLAGAEREAKEAGFFEALKAGSTTVELLGLDASLVRQGEPGGRTGRAGSAGAPGALALSWCWHNATHERRDDGHGGDGGADGGGAHDPGCGEPDLCSAQRPEGSRRHRQLRHADGLDGRTGGQGRGRVRDPHGSRGAQRLSNGSLRRHGPHHDVRTRPRDRLDDSGADQAADRSHLRIHARAEREDGTTWSPRTTTGRSSILSGKRRTSSRSSPSRPCARRWAFWRGRSHTPTHGDGGVRRPACGG